MRRLDSVWCAGDAEFLEAALSFYPAAEPRLILDATVNAGRFWRGGARRVIGLDLNRAHRPAVQGDNRRMPFGPGVFDVVVYDPPHVPNQGRDRRKDFVHRFGLGAKSGSATGYTLEWTYPGFLAEAHRVLAADGLVLAKLTDYVHNHRSQFAHIGFHGRAVAAGFTACDLIVKVRSSTVRDPKWVVSHHARKTHCYWWVLRKSKYCERRRHK